MSRIFEALRKSEKQLQTGPEVAPETFLDVMEGDGTLAKTPVVHARVTEDTRLVVLTEPRGLAAERFRLLRAQLVQRRESMGRKLQTILITSSTPQEGKTWVSINLATTLAQQGKTKVLLIEGDLRKGTVNEFLQMRLRGGLSSCLEQGADPFSVVRRVEPLGFYFLPGGTPRANPVDLFQSERLSELLNQLEKCFDWVILDAPPLGLIADAGILKKHADGVLLVVRSGKTPREWVKESIGQIDGENLLGVVLNGAEGLDRAYYGYHYYAGGGNARPRQGNALRRGGEEGGGT